MAKDLQAKIQSLGQRLKEEYNSKSPDLLDTESEKSKPPTKALLGLNISSGTRKQRPGSHLRVLYMAPNVRSLCTRNRTGLVFVPWLLLSPLQLVPGSSYNILKRSWRVFICLLDVWTGKTIKVSKPAT